MMDIAAMVQQAMELLRSDVATYANAVAAGLSASTLYDWFTRKLTRKAAAGALEEAAENPKSETNWEALRIQILKELEENEDFRNELMERLKEAGVPNVRMGIGKVEGDRNVVVQASGSKVDIKTN